MDLIEARARGSAAAGAARHPWETARCAAVLALLGEAGLFAPGAPCVRVLDVGAGDGFVASRLVARLPRGSRVSCWDEGYTPGELAAPLDAGLERTSTRPAGRFDVLLFLDVLEHARDDHALLRETLEATAAPSAWVLVTVPAWQALFGAHDRWLGHERRYDPRALGALLRGAGLRVVARGALFATLLAPRCIAVALERLRGASRAASSGVAVWRGGPVVTAALDAALRLDAAVGRGAARRGVPWPGLSLFAIARAEGPSP